MKKQHKIISIVFSFHLLILFILYVGEKKNSSLNNNKKIVVNTVMIKEVKPKVKEIKKPLPKKIVIKKAPKKSPPKVVAKKKVPSPNKPLAAKEKSKLVVSQSLLDKLEQNLSSLDKNSKQQSYGETLTVPSITPLEVAKISKMDISDPNINFQGKLVSFLKDHLKLPEYGEVKLQMKVKKGGRIEDIVILSSKNKRNSEYLKEVLFKMSIPLLNDYLSKDNTMDLVICFTNDI